jgi:hypothetical protein
MVGTSRHQTGFFWARAAATPCNERQRWEGSDTKRTFFGPGQRQRPATVGNSGPEPTANGIFLGGGSGDVRQRWETVGTIRQQTGFFGPGQRRDRYPSQGIRLNSARSIILRPVIEGA